MQDFARLYETLDASTSTQAKLAALRGYFSVAAPADAAWAAYFLSGGRPRQLVPTALLRQTACELAGLSDWLFEASYQAVGDLAETIALVLPEPGLPARGSLAEWVEQRLLPLRGQPPEAQRAAVGEAWRALDATGRFLIVKLMGGGWRVGVSRQLVQRALAEVAGLAPALVAQRMVGWTDARHMPDAARYLALVAPAPAPGNGTVERTDGAPYPFFLAHALAAPPAETALGEPQDWLVEWKFDGIRAQVVRRGTGCWIWSRGEELVTDRLPEVEAAARARLPAGCVLDGELLVWPPQAPRPASFQALQPRLQRKTVPRSLLRDAPVVFVAYDLLESDGQDRRAEPQAARRARLAALALPEATAAPGATLRLSPELIAPDWPAVQALQAGARERGVEGLMLKQRSARYGLGRTKAEGLWWKWKVEPWRVDAILVYAQAGHGRRAGLCTDYTFAVWNRAPLDAAEAQAVLDAAGHPRDAAPAPPDAGGLQLLTFAKAYSGLSDAEFRAVDRVIRATTVERFGPVRSVRPTLVVEIGFEGLAASARHKSGVAVRFPRMLRLRPDKPLHEADTLASLHALARGA